MPRYRLVIEYDGRPYAGWQKQNDRPSVQEALINAVFHFSGQHVEVIAAGRTDAGVHATAQVVHIDLAKHYDPFKVMQGVNFYLFNPPRVGEYDGKLWPENRVSILEAVEMPDTFHARFSATGRHYLYRIINRRARLGLEAGRAWHVLEPLDENAMQKAANILVGHHDFTTFRDTQCQAKSPIKTLDTLTVTRRGQEIHITASARSFLHHQVRNMVGTLSLVGKGKWSVQDVQHALDARDRSQGGPTCPPDGLYLTGVDY